MTTPEITAVKLAGFNGNVETVAGLKLHKPTFSTMLILENTGSPLLAETLDRADPPTMMRAVGQYLLLHSRDRKQVQELAADEKAAGDELLSICDRLPAADLWPLAEAIHANLRLLYRTADWEVKSTGSTNPTPPAGAPSIAAPSPD